MPEPFNPQSLNRYGYVMNDPVNRIDPTGLTSLFGLKLSFTGGSAYNGSIYQTDYGYDVYVGSGTYYSASPRPSAPYREDRPSAPMPQQITGESIRFSQAIPAQPVRAANSGRAFDPEPDFSLGPSFGLIPQAEICGDRFCDFQPANSALGVGQALLVPPAVKGIAVESGQLALAITRNNRAAKAALDAAGLFRPALNSAGKILQKSWMTSRFMAANA